MPKDPPPFGSRSIIFRRGSEGVPPAACAADISYPLLLLLFAQFNDQNGRDFSLGLQGAPRKGSYSSPESPI